MFVLSLLFGNAINMQTTNSGLSNYEVERGKPMPSLNHSFIQYRIGKLIDKKYEGKFFPLPELSLAIDDTPKIPDLAIYDRLAIDLAFDKTKFAEMPLCVVEILSPKQNIGDLIAKSYAYFDAGVLSYWLVIPELRTIYVFSAKGEYEVYAKADLLKDTKARIELDLEQVFSVEL